MFGICYPVQEIVRWIYKTGRETVKRSAEKSLQCQIEKIQERKAVVTIPVREKKSMVHYNGTDIEHIMARDRDGARQGIMPSLKQECV